MGGVDVCINERGEFVVADGQRGRSVRSVSKCLPHAVPLAIEADADLVRCHLMLMLEGLTAFMITTDYVYVNVSDVLRKYDSKVDLATKVSAVV